jgi:hydrogenase maturation factor
LRTILSLFVLLGFSAATMFAADQTWTGKISDSMCGASHKSATEHGGKKMSDRDCSLACVKDHQAKYVFVHNGKVLNIANQDAAGLEEHAGHTVKLTGTLNGDTITVSKIEMSGHMKKKAPTA